MDLLEIDTNTYVNFVANDIETALTLGCSCANRKWDGTSGRKMYAGFDELVTGDEIPNVEVNYKPFIF